MSAVHREIESLRAQLAATEANIEWVNGVNGKLIEQVGELQHRLQIARKARERLEAKTRIEGKPTNAIEAMLADYNNIARNALAAINGADK